MNIAIDLRSLSSGAISGVENYCLNLLEHLLPLDKNNRYTLFYNAFGENPMADFHFVNSKIKRSRLPNKFLNAVLKFRLMPLEKLVGDFDVLFLPNLNQFNIQKGKKLAITVHDLSPIITPQFYDIKRRVWHKFLDYKKSFQSADILFATSEYTKKDLVGIFNIKPEKIVVARPAVDLKVFNPEISESELREARNIYGLPGKYILFLNTIEPRKNLSGLIKAFEKIHNDSYLVIAGRLGWKYGNDFRLINKSKKSAKIKYIGYVQEVHKPALIKQAAALAYPSFYEGFGFQPLEAMAIGTPVAASFVTSLPELVADAGLLGNPYNTDEMAMALDALLDNENLCNNLIHKGLNRAKETSWNKAAEIILNGLNSLYK